jgi:hypothetical protein
MQRSSCDRIAFSDDALRMASAVRRTRKMDKLDGGSKRRRGEGAETHSAQKVDTIRLSVLSEMHSAAANKAPRPSESTAGRAIIACDELSTKPISEGGLG